LAEWEVSARVATAEARIELEKQVGIVRSRVDDLVYRMELLKGASAEAWQEIAHGADEARPIPRANVDGLLDCRCRACRVVPSVPDAFGEREKGVGGEAGVVETDLRFEVREPAQSGARGPRSNDDWWRREGGWEISDEALLRGAGLRTLDLVCRLPSVVCRLKPTARMHPLPRPSANDAGAGAYRTADQSPDQHGLRELEHGAGEITVPEAHVED